MIDGVANESDRAGLSEQKGGADDLKKKRVGHET